MSIRTFLCARLCPPPAVQPIDRPFTILHHVSGKHIRTVLHAAFPDAHIRIADAEYTTTSIDEFNTWLKNDCVSERQYYSGWLDCDNFSRMLRCKMFGIGRNYKTEFTMAYTEGMSPGGYHAFCIFLDSDDKIWIVEPQTDFLSTPDESNYKPDFIQL